MGVVLSARAQELGVQLGKRYFIDVWDDEVVDASVPGSLVVGRLVSTAAQMKRYEGQVFWIVEGDWIIHLIPEDMIQGVTEAKGRWL